MQIPIANHYSGTFMNRMGALGDIPLVFKPEISRFQNADKHAFANAQAAHQQRAPANRRGGFRGE